MNNRLLEAYGNRTSSTGGTSSGSNRLLSSYSDWEKKKKKQQPQGVAANAGIGYDNLQNTEPITPKPVDQIEHEKTWENKSLLEKTWSGIKEIPNTIGEHFKKTGEALESNAGFEPNKNWDEMSFGEKAKSAAFEAPATITRGVLNAGIKTGEGVSAGIAFTSKITGNEKGEEAWNKISLGLQDYATQYKNGLKPQSFDENVSIFDDPSLIINPEWIFRNAMEQLPNLTVMTKTAGLGEGFLELGAFYSERIAKAREKGTTPDAKDVVSAGAIGIINGIIGKLGYDLVFKKNPALKKFVEQKINSAVRKVVGTVVSTGFEMGGEFTQEVIPKIATKIIYDEGGTWQEVWKEAKQSGKVAAGVAGAISAPISAGNIFTSEGVAGVAPAIVEREEEKELPKELKITPAENVNKPIISEFIEALSSNDKVKISQLENNVTTEEINQLLEKLDKAYVSADPELKKTIGEDMDYLTTLSDKRTETIHGALNETLTGNNKIDELPDDQRQEAVDTLIKAKKSTHELAPKVQEISAKIEKTNKKVDENIAKLKEVKSELLESKRAEEDKEIKKEIQTKIDALDDVRFKVEKSRNRTLFDEKVEEETKLTLSPNFIEEAKQLKKEVDLKKSKETKSPIIQEARISKDYVAEVKKTTNADLKKVGTYGEAGKAKNSARTKLSNDITNREIEIAQRDQKIFDSNKNKSIEQLQNEINNSKKFAENNNSSYDRSISVKQDIINLKSQPLQEGVKKEAEIKKGGQEPLAFSMRKKEAITRGKLLVVHNLSEQKLRFANRIGGLSNPSMAVIDPEKTGFESYGYITLIPRSDIIRGEKTHLADAYTPRFPSVHSFMSYENFKKFEEWIEPFYKEIGEDIRKVHNSDDSIIREIENNPAVALRFLKENKITPSKEGQHYYHSQINTEKLDSEFEVFLDKIYQRFEVEEKLFAGYTYSGNRRYKALSLYEASKIMSKQKEEGFNYGLGSYRSKIAPIKRNPESIRKESDRLVSKEDFEKIRDEYDTELSAIQEELAPYAKNIDNNQFIEYDRQNEAIGSVIMGERDAMTYFKNKFENVPDKIMQKVYAFANKLREMPTEYFETKFKRAVSLEEFSTALIPDNANKETREILKKNGIDVIEYKENKRQEALKEVLRNETLAFSNRATRGSDGKFTGSLPDTITQEMVEEHISKGLAFQYAKQVMKETNPVIASAFEIKIFEQLTYGKGDSEYEMDGYYSATKGLIALSEKVPTKDFIPLARHEIRHTAFTLLPIEKQNKIKDWYSNLGEDEKMMFYGYPALYHDYLRKSKSNVDPILFMADETFNRFMGQNEGGKRTPLQKLIDDMVAAIMRLLERINRAIFKNAKFTEKVNQQKLKDLYKNVFTQKTGDFIVPEGYLALLKEKGFSSGRISFEDYLYSDGGEAGFAVEKKLATQAEILAKLLDERSALSKEKRSMEKNFAESPEGRAMENKNLLEAEKAGQANPKVLQGIKNNPRFIKEKTISDAMGSGWLMNKKGRQVVVEADKVDTYIERGYTKDIEIDSLASEAGFERGEDYLNDQLQRTAPLKLETAIKKHLTYTDTIYQDILAKIQNATDELAKAKNDKNAFFLGMKVGGSVMRAKFKEKMSLWKQRKEKVRAAKDFFKLGDSVFKKIGGNRDVQYMSNNEFDGFMKHLETQAEREILHSNAKAMVISQIQEKQLKKTDNLRRALKLPTIDKMTTDQLKQFDEALETAQPEDEFLTQRMIETLRLTELAGIRTVREAREILDKKLGKNFKEKGIKISPLVDRLRWDAPLAESNEFMKLLVMEKDMAFLKADAKTLTAEMEVDKLAKQSRKSISRTLGDRLVPEDPQVFDYLEKDNKVELASQMTPEQLQLATWLQGEFEKMRDYLIQNKQLKAYRENYITHIRKDFLEVWKNDGLFPAIKGVFEQQQMDEAAFEILSGETEEIMPFEKWFQFAMRRSGIIDPSKNVERAYIAYKHTFERKVALDSLIPKIMTYVYSLTPTKKTEKGLVMDRSIRKFVVSWLNSKKGRRFDFGGFLKQGSKADTALLFLRTFTSLIDLGASIPIGIASNFGEQSANFIYLGSKGYLKGVARVQTKRGRAIVAKYENFVRKTPWKTLSQGSNHIGNKFMGGMFYLFHSSQVRANKSFLLGAMTDAEFQAGEISLERLAQMKIDMGRWRIVEGDKSIIGNTSLGGVLMQYKTWGVVMLRTTLKNAEILVKNRQLNSREGKEAIRQVLLTSAIGLMTLLAFTDDDDNSFLATLYKKVIRDTLSAIQALDPTLYITDPRVFKFLVDLTSSLKMIATMETYAPSNKKQHGELKGLNKLQRTLSPNIFKQFVESDYVIPKKYNITD